ncbi:Transcriptional regulatory protein LiaR [compost metagenome]
MRTALASGDSDSARAWIAHCAMEMVEYGDFLILLDWQRQLHDRLLEIPVQLKIALGWAAGLAMSMDSARQLLEEVRTALPAIEDETARSNLTWECRAMEAMLLALEDRSEAGGQLASACLPHLRQRPWVSNTLLNVVCYSHLRACRWPEFYTSPPMASTPRDPHRYQFNQVYRLCLMGLGEALQGRFSQAVAILEEGMRITISQQDDRGVRRHPVLRALPASLLASIRYLQGNILEAERLSVENIDTVKISAFLDCAAILYITTSRLSSGHASPQGARYFLEEGDRLAQTRSWPRMQAQLLLERTRVSLIEHKTHEANACVAQLEALALANPPEIDGHLSEFACLASLAALWCEASGQSRMADLQQAEHLHQQARRLNLRLMQLRLAASMAMVHWKRGAPEQASTWLLDAAGLMEHCDASQILADIPAQAALQQMLAQTLQMPGVSQVLKARLQRMLPGETDPAASPSASRMMISLTSKERHVLELVAKGKSNKEMAKLLSVTPETIKSHMKNIFSKLQVDSRAQAAVAAKACGLI